MITHFRLTLLLFVVSLAQACALSETKVESPAKEQPVRLSEAEAVQVAEKFVKENCYSDYPKEVCREKLYSDVTERDFDREGLISTRFNSVERKAFGARKSEKGWEIAFRHKKKADPREYSSPDICRVVLVSEDGSEITMVHKTRHYEVL